VIRWLIAKVVALAIPLRFDPSQAAGIDATLELQIGIRGRVACFTIAIEDSRCEVRVAPAPDPDARASVSLANLIRLALGDAAWPQLLSRGRFVLTGDPFLAMRLPMLFRLAARAGW
jgi:hypothetical protein